MRRALRRIPPRGVPRETSGNGLGRLESGQIALRHRVPRETLGFGGVCRPCSPVFYPLVTPFFVFFATFLSPFAAFSPVMLSFCCLFAVPWRPFHCPSMALDCCLLGGFACFLSLFTLATLALPFFAPFCVPPCPSGCAPLLGSTRLPPCAAL